MKYTPKNKEVNDEFTKVEYAEQYAKEQVLKELQYIRELIYDCFNPPYLKKFDKRIEELEKELQVKK